MAQKYDLKGDSIILSDEEDEMDYAFQVADITQYSSPGYMIYGYRQHERSLSDNIGCTIWLYQKKNCRLTLENYIRSK